MGQRDLLVGGLLDPDLHRGIAVVDLRSGERLRHDETERVEVRLWPHGRPADLLGRHVAGRPDDLAIVRDARLLLVLPGQLDPAGDPEIQDLHEVRLARVIDEQHVRRLDVAMHDAKRVRLHQRLQDLRRDASHAEGRERASPQLLLDRSTAQELEHDERQSELGGPEVEEAHGVGMLEALDQRGLAREPLEHAVRVHGLDEDHLDGDLAAERLLDGAIHGAVAALTEELDELVPPGDHLPRNKRRPGLRVFRGRFHLS